MGLGRRFHAAHSTSADSPSSSLELQHQKLVLPACGMQEPCTPCCPMGKLRHRPSICGSPREGTRVTGTEGNSCWSPLSPTALVPRRFPTKSLCPPFLGPFSPSLCGHGCLGGKPGTTCAVPGSVLHGVRRWRCCCPCAFVSPLPLMRCVPDQQWGVPSLAHHIPGSPPRPLP